AGPNHVVELVNTAIRIYDKSKDPVRIVSTHELSEFFSSLGTLGQMSDPQTSYDELTNRFVVGVLDFDLPGSGPSHFDFAVSDTSDPSGGWAFRRYDMNDLVEGIADFADYPRLGWNADAYVVSFNMFLTAATFDHVDTLGIFNTNDARILNAAWRGDRLVASQTVAGLFSAHARWYDLSTAGVAPALRQSGEINPGLLVSSYYPSIEINAAGDLGLTYMQSSFRQ